MPDDAPDTMMFGFPIPFGCDGWHTSLSLQIFMLEFIADLLIYFISWLIIAGFIHHFILPIKIKRKIYILLFSLVDLAISLPILIASNPDNTFYLKRDFDIKVVKTRYRFIWESNSRPIVETNTN